MVIVPRSSTSTVVSPEKQMVGTLTFTGADVTGDVTLDPTVVGAGDVGEGALGARVVGVALTLDVGAEVVGVVLVIGVTLPGAIVLGTTV
jgi:hypothetical protein